MAEELKINKVEVRQLRLEDYKELAQSFKRVYADKDVFWTYEQIKKLTEIFPEGQVVTVVDNKIVGCALSLIVNYDMVKGDHTYAKVTGNETFNTHNPNGNILYGIEVFIHPDYRGLRLARRMYDYRKELCETLNLKAIMFGGRIPNYYKYADQGMRPREYINKVKSRDIYDPVLTFQLSNDFHVRRIITNYLPNDEESKHYATLLQWDNIYYQPKPEVTDKKNSVRVGLVQWQMRPYKDLDVLFEQIEFFVDAVSDYQSDFILFPEYFNAPLMAKYNHLGEAESIRALAQYTEEIRERFIKLAISYNINIITGSMPSLSDNKLKNVGFLCRRDGSYEMYEKIHITPDEIKSWGLSGGDRIQVFETDCARIGVLICYDVEFPELSRILADQDMQILFVPFLTDTQNGYSRVRVCAQARAIENECFVAIAGSVGNLPRVHNMDIQYAQSAVFTPCDFQFPTDGKRAEATPNTEMILVSDVDLDLLTELHTYGNVRNLRDRRLDLYDLKTKK
ncbi:MAG: bifunctional GNAT family N-acetyltransferase/carbon-nitrogen hydrolase family protein [Muribaculaceae bacterium]|jgi:predicted amidohydrolase/ribosomal protein S18 acetylase RimI-like enzyme|nr:bifunctional GNAT family N-acetyltransferase/carbon-nitrogen hydrolase family protein [Muribaculaceae bacterium]